jgi:putative ABC transport system permease protein
MTKARSYQDVPRIARFILERCLYQEFRQGALGDFVEQYKWLLNNQGRFRARIWLWIQVVQLAVPKCIDSITESVYMIKNYLRVTLRHFQRRKLFSFINIMGLSAGMAACLLLLLWIRHEFSYDNYHPDLDRVYRVAMLFESPSLTLSFAKLGPPVAGRLNDDYPQVEAAARLMRSFNPIVRRGQTVFNESRTYYAEPSIFDILSLPLVAGDAETALDRPHTVVLSRPMVSKYFNAANSLGQTIEIDGQTFEITGVMEAYPENTHLKCDFLLSLQTMADERLDTAWGWTNFATYVKLRPGIDVQAFGEELRTLENRYRDVELLKQQGMSNTYWLQPVKSIHLHSHLAGETEPPGSLSMVLITTSIGLLILLVACINFVNLSTAQFTLRAREVGMRKVVGANRKQLIIQFLGESFTLSFFAFLAALVLAILGIGLLNDLTGRHFMFKDLVNPVHLLMFLGVFVFVGLAAGLYPAFVLSLFKPTEVLRSGPGSGFRSGVLRKALVVFQFSVSTLLIISAFIIQGQMHFMRTQDLGFDKEQKLVIPFGGEYLKDQRSESIKTEFLSLPGVYGATASFGVPGRVIAAWATSLVGAGENSYKRMSYLLHDFDFLSLYDIKIVAGRPFDPQLRTDIGEAFILNETAVKILGLTEAGDAIGRRIETGYGQQGTVVGVTRDFHFEGLTQAIEPMVLALNPGREVSRYFPNGHLTLVVDSQNLPDLLPRVKQLWKTMHSSIPYSYSFVDEIFDQYYQEERRIQRIISTFTLLGLIIACLGLFGLVSFSAQQRTKEIGIRKVLGASVGRVVGELSRGFFVLVASANLIAWPVGYLVMNRWLSNFSYRSPLSLWPFVLASVLTLLIVLLTMGIWFVRAALSNPVDALRYE